MFDRSSRKEASPPYTDLPNARELATKCGRTAQTSPFHEYVEKIGWNPHALFNVPVATRFNIPPGTHPAVPHRPDEFDEMVRLHWGYKPRRYTKRPVSNARVDTINDPSKSFLRGPFQHGRVIVPANGWYEWTGEKPNKLPWFIYAAENSPQRASRKRGLSMKGFRGYTPPSLAQLATLRAELNRTVKSWRGSQPPRTVVNGTDIRAELRRAR
jgi:hypothetical protein